MKAGADRPGGVRRGRGHRPALRALHLGHHRQAQGHRPRQRRARGRDGLVAAQHLRRARGPGLVGGLRRRLGRRPLLHRLRAADQRRHHRALRGQAGRHARRRRVLAGRSPSTASRRCSPRRPRSGRSRRRTRTARLLAGHDLAAFRTLFLAGERLDPDTYHWATERLGVPGGRQLVADRDRLADRGEPARPRADADQAGLADRAGARLRRRGARRARHAASPRARRARSASGCRCRRARCPRCGATTSGTSRRTCRPSRATTSPATAATSTRTATCS